VFTPIKDLGLVVMIDEDNPSFKQEQSPFYATRDVLMMRQRREGFKVDFIGATPSIDLWFRVKRGELACKELSGPAVPQPIAVDLNDYKYIPGLLSVPLRNGIEATLKSKGKAILVLNRRGAYSLTRCQDCGKVLSCAHCDAALIYSRIEKKFQCNHCTFHLPANASCVYCKKSNWKSVRMGIEQLQGELIKYFPTAVIASFDGESKGEVKGFDILIATQAILRFKARLKAPLVAMMDFNAEINRMDIGSAFKAWSLARQLNAMATQQMFIQTRNNDHYVVRSLIRNKPEIFYDEELQLRKELGFAPFKHWVQVMLRSKNEKSAQEMAQAVYNELSQRAGESYAVMSPAPDAVFKKRDQYRFNVAVQGEQVIATMDLVKSALAQVKRSSRVIVTLNVD
jgi:primosomal protein N' (replication factor Y)